MMAIDPELNGASQLWVSCLSVHSDQLIMN